jgi:MFS family permease
VIDRFGARATAAGAGLALAAGYGGLALATTPGLAFAAAAVAGAGNGALLPSQSTLVTSLTAPELRHRATAVSRVAGNLGAGIGAALGGLVAASGLPGFIALFLANAVTYLLYVGILVALVRADVRTAPVAGGYRVVVRLALINVAVIAVGWGVFTWIVPVYARGELAIGPGPIGLLLFANALAVVFAQIPVSRLAEGRRRTAAIAAGAFIFAGSSLLVLVPVYPALLVAVVAVGIGECCHTTALTPLVADLAPPALRGRYMAAMGLSWWLGLALAPTLGTVLLSVSPTATMVAAPVSRWPRRDSRRGRVSRRRGGARGAAPRRRTRRPRRPGRPRRCRTTGRRPRASRRRRPRRARSCSPAGPRRSGRGPARG